MELSQGVQLGEEFHASRLVLARVLDYTARLFRKTGCRHPADRVRCAACGICQSSPAKRSLMVWCVLLKALADPTRLKILFYLSRESMTPTSYRLQLRPPTVTHHLSELRLASLVELSLEHEEKRYAIRKQALEGAFENLTSFLQNDPTRE